MEFDQILPWGTEKKVTFKSSAENGFFVVYNLANPEDHRVLNRIDLAGVPDDDAQKIASGDTTTMHQYLLLDENDMSVHYFRQYLDEYRCSGIFDVRRPGNIFSSVVHKIVEVVPYAPGQN